MKNSFFPSQGKRGVCKVTVLLRSMETQTGRQRNSKPRAFIKMGKQLLFSSSRDPGLTPPMVLDLSVSLHKMHWAHWHLHWASIFFIMRKLIVSETCLDETYASDRHHASLRCHCLFWFKEIIWRFACWIQYWDKSEPFPHYLSSSRTGLLQFITELTLWYFTQPALQAWRLGSSAYVIKYSEVLNCTCLRGGKNNAMRFRKLIYNHREQIKHYLKIKRRCGIIYLIANATATSAGPVKTWKRPSAHQHPTIGAGNDVVLAKCFAAVWPLRGQRLIVFILYGSFLI